MKRKNKPAEEQTINVGDSVLYFSQTYTVVETDDHNIQGENPKVLLSYENPKILLHIKAVEYPFNSLWVKQSDISVVTKGVNYE